MIRGVLVACGNILFMQWPTQCGGRRARQVPRESHAFIVGLLLEEERRDGTKI